MNNTKIRCRITFEKKDLARFVGHLDLQTLFQRALKRARVPVAYSQGFNPHMLISFAQPLPLGMESLCEMVDIELTREVEPSEIINGLNTSLPTGFRVIGAVFLPPQTKRVAAAIYAAKYKAAFSNTPPIEQLIDAIDLVSAGNDPYAAIADKIISMKFNQADNTIEMTLCAGGEKNLKPAVAVASICENAEIELTTSSISYTRTAILLK